MQFLASIASLALLPSLLLAAPTSCPNQPVTVDLTLSNILYNSSYTYSTPAHLATKQGQISFDLTNSALNYVTHCYASSSWEFLFFLGNINYTCAVPAGAPAGANANFTFSSTNGAFNVNQTYAASGHNLLAYGAGQAKLDCETNKYQNPNWTMGQIYSSTTTTCKPTSLKIKAKVGSA